ncbi:hypothetical protein Agub_g3842 [Astrephomene gubernaculifera]|uniref:F-box domain-containing protein n=1 Tax=Astrephomene gubernaculifera TaxID=47775 RepID=A0AAD3DLT9_9CHLO|nr:hypothetical protein Agub_g3842 [Astrephomene gubernaculifera]
MTILDNSQGNGGSNDEEVGRTLLQLPNSVLTSILESLAAMCNPGQVMKLALACRTLLRAISEAEGFWERMCISHGWSRPATRPRASGTSARDLDWRWFRYYSARMTSRRNVRRFFKLYIPFLSRPSSMALMPGASPAQLSACEARLGALLPWELWELLRFRGGQAAGPGVAFLDDMRLLGVEELLPERPPGLADLRQRLGLLGAPPRAQDMAAPGEQEQGGGGGGNAAVTPGVAAPPAGAAASAAPVDPAAPEEEEVAVAVASNPSGSRRLLVALSGGHVYLARGLSLASFAPGVAAMLQKILT